MREKVFIPTLTLIIISFLVFRYMVIIIWKKQRLPEVVYRFSCGRDRRLKEMWGDVMSYEEKVENTAKAP